MIKLIIFAAATFIASSAAAIDMDAAKRDISRFCNADRVCIAEEFKAAGEIVKMNASVQTAKGCAIAYVLANGQNMSKLFRFMKGCLR